MAASTLVCTRFDLIHKASNKDADTLLGRFDLPVVPLPGELVNINGNPYIAIERGWAIGTDKPDTGRLFAYVRVVKAGTNF